MKHDSVSSYLKFNQKKKKRTQAQKNTNLR